MSKDIYNFYYYFKLLVKHTYLVKFLFKSLDSDTRLAVIADMKRLASDEKKILEINSDPVGNLQYYFVQNRIFRSIFYARCRRESIGNRRIGFLWAICKHYYPAHDSIGINTDKIGAGLLIHHGPVTVGREVIIGNNVSLNGGDIIGRRHGGSPVLRDNVRIGANASVVGPIEIGENSIIGAGSVVVKDVPANMVVAGNPARVLHERTNENPGCVQRKTDSV